MSETVTISDLIRIAVIIMGIWGFYKVVMEIVDRITARHDKEQKWDEMENALNVAREQIIIKYDSKLAEMEKNIAENYADTESKLQQIRAEQYMLTTCMLAVLDGLHQLGANGKVTESRHELEKYLVGAATNNVR